MMPLISEEATSDAIISLLREDLEIAAWWGTLVERSVAISRLVREGLFDEVDEIPVRVALSLFADYWTEVEPTDEIRLSAAILSRDHPLKAADALRLAAIRWCEGETTAKGFVCLDNRLRRAAQAEGFEILPETLETI
jgi:predicted nucleic acid-binding protein